MSSGCSLDLGISNYAAIAIKNLSTHSLQRKPLNGAGTGSVRETIAKRGIAYHSAHRSGECGDVPRRNSKCIDFGTYELADAASKGGDDRPRASHGLSDNTAEGFGLCTGVCNNI